MSGAQRHFSGDGSLASCTQNATSGKSRSKANKVRTFVRISRAFPPHAQPVSPPRDVIRKSATTKSLTMGASRSKPQEEAPPPDEQRPPKQQRTGDVIRPLMLPASGSVWAAISNGNSNGGGDGNGDGDGDGNSEGDECASTPGHEQHPPQPSRDTCLLLVGCCWSNPA